MDDDRCTDIVRVDREGVGDEQVLDDLLDRQHQQQDL